MSKKRYLVAGASLLLTAAFALGYWVSGARASGIPAVGALTYSGTLTNSDGSFVTTQQNILVQFYTVATGGTAACTSQPTTVTPVAGTFQVPLGDDCTTLVRNNTDISDEILVGGAPVGRTKLGADPYAVEAAHAVSATTATTATTAQTATSLAAGPISTGLTYYQVLGNALTAPCVSAGGGTVDCTCPTGTYVVSGGGWSAVGQAVRENRPLSTTTWRVTCDNTTADVLCQGYDLICSRVGP